MGTRFCRVSAFELLPFALVLMRRINRLTQAEAAQRAGMRGPQLSRYESGEVQPQLAQLDRLLRVYGATLFDLAVILSAIRTPERVLTAADRADEIRDSAGTSFLLREGGMLVPRDSYQIIAGLMSQLHRLLDSVEEVYLGRALREGLEVPEKNDG